MTEEQIKQNAEEYAEQNEVNFSEDKNFAVYDYDEQKEAYLAGAHSRDEEIEELQNELESLRKGFYERGDKLKELMLANNKLRNPWISVEDMLPEEHSRVLIMFCNGTVTYNDYIGVGDINYMKAHPEIITHWMLIPALNPAEQLISGLQEMNEQFKKG